MIMDDVFTLRSNQTHRKRELKQWNCQHTDTAAICRHYCPESKEPKSRGGAGSFTLAVKSYFHVIGHFWKEALQWLALSTCRFPTGPTQEVIL